MFVVVKNFDPLLITKVDILMTLRIETKYSLQYLFFLHFNSLFFFSFNLSIFLFFADLYLSQFVSNRREEVTKLKFEAKTFHIYANQTEVNTVIKSTVLKLYAIFFLVKHCGL